VAGTVAFILPYRVARPSSAWAGVFLDERRPKVRTSLQSRIDRDLANRILFLNATLAH
jgi:hypothetical protein